jgi:predicted RNase H-like HicB family nuclease
MKPPTFLHVHVHIAPGQDLWADIEELPGCFASGRDMSELRDALDEAVSLYLSEPGEESRYELDVVEERGFARPAGSAASRVTA